jgi:hypothetical protein
MSTVGQQYAEFIKAELDAERERRTALDGRGAGIVGTTSGLATAVFAIGALVTGRAGYSPDRVSVVALLVGLGLFSAAAGCGLAASRTIAYDVTARMVYEQMVGGQWGDPEEQARRVVAYRNQVTLVSLRAGNNKKAWWLPVAYWLQIAAAAALLVAVGNVLIKAV